MVTEHYIENKHNFNFENIKILDKEPLYHKRTISEMFFIQLQDNSINKKEDTQKLFPPYRSVIHKFKQQ